MEPVKRRSRNEASQVRTLILARLQQGQKMPQIREDLNLTRSAAEKQISTLKQKLPLEDAKKFEQLLASVRAGRRSSKETPKLRGLILARLQQGQKMSQIRKDLGLTFSAAWKQFAMIKRNLSLDDAKKFEQLLASARAFQGKKTSVAGVISKPRPQRFNDAKAAELISIAKALMKGEASLLLRRAYKGVLIINGKAFSSDAGSIKALTKYIDSIAERAGLSLTEKAVLYTRILNIRKYWIADYMGASSDTVNLIIESAREKIKKSGIIKSGQLL